MNRKDAHMLKNLVVTVLLAICILTLTACNTLRGMGKDIEKAGESIQKAADK
jgi:predicted small secreted protein